MRFFALSLIMAAWPVFPNPKQLAKLQKLYDKTQSFDAEFSQCYYTKIFKRTQKSDGVLSYQKPGKMRWDYLKPVQKSFILNKKTLWLFEPTDKIAYINRCVESDSLATSLVFLGGKGKLADEFELLKNTSKNQLFLSPKIQNPILKQLILKLDSKTGRVIQSTVIDNEGNENKFDFRKSRFNPKIPEERFVFKPNPDIEVLDMPGSCLPVQVSEDKIDTPQNSH